MTDHQLEARRELLEQELGEVLCALWGQLLEVWPEPVVGEPLMFLGLGVFSGAYTPHQVIERLGLDKNQIYKALGAETAAAWRAMIQELGYDAFLRAVSTVLEKKCSQSQSRVPDDHSRRQSVSSLCSEDGVHLQVVGRRLQSRPERTRWGGVDD